MRASPTIARVQQLLDSGRVTDGAHHLQAQAEAGGVHAIIELAQWRIAGDIVRRDLAAARALLGRAA